MMRRLAVPAWVAALTVLLLWPQRHAGYALGRDLVFTPQQPLNAAAFGVSSAPPRAVPVDALVAVLSHVLGGGAVVGRVALAVPLLLAGLGVAALLQHAALPAQLLGAGFAVWNPYVVERLALGQWSLLWGYAALPWLLVVLRRDRPGVRGAAGLVLAVAVASITPTGGLLAVLVVVVFALVRRRGVRSVLLAVALQLPWLVAAVLSTAARTSDPASADAFAARGEFGGAVLSVLGLGGTWNAAVVPASRETAWSLVALLVVAFAALIGRRRLIALIGRPVVTTLLICSVIGVAVVGLSTASLLDAVVARVPGGGLLRDSHKWIAPLVVLSAVVLGAAVDVLWQHLRRSLAPLLVIAGLALPLALLPDATTVVWPTVTPVRYPSGFASVDRLVDGGVVAVLPFQPYRQFAWTGGRPSLDPAPRLLDADVIVSDRLQVGSDLLAGEDPRAARVAAALGRPDLPAALAGAGVRWVLVERRTPGTVPALTGLSLRYADPDVRLYRVPGTVEPVAADGWRLAVAVEAFALWLLVVALAAVVVVVSIVRERRAVSARA